LPYDFTRLDERCVNAIRVLGIDMIEKSKSGHPGAAMALAPAAYLLYSRFLKHNPKNPDWLNRDRFILSCGHVSVLLYSTLHLSGYSISLDDLKNFRQWRSIAAGHPEQGLAPGVETTSGPLGQGCAASVGMAIAETHLADRFNTRDHTVVDHHTWVLCSDGDMMEGVSHEAASLAGHLRLGKLIWIYDDNRVTIDGPTSISLSDDTDKRFEACGWHVQSVQDVNDLPLLAQAMSRAKNETQRPSLIRVRTHIGFGAPNKQDRSAAHGSPLGSDETKATKIAYGWDSDEPFHIPTEISNHCLQAISRGEQAEIDWLATLKQWRTANPLLASEWDRTLLGDLPDNWDRDIPLFPPDEKGSGTRISSWKILNAIAPHIPELIGGSADLAASVKSNMTKCRDFSAENRGGRNLHFGIREHAMAAILNGVSLHRGLRPFGSTFLVFSDYMRPSIRLAALMKLPVIYIWSHDAINIGEDGPTHQPVEHLAALRSIPGLTIIRPADANETVAAWRVIIKSRSGPVGLILTRQNAPTLSETMGKSEQGVAHGAYILSEPEGDGDLDAIIIATGYEVHLALAAQKKMQDHGTSVRVVSMPSWELFDLQSKDYRERVLPPNTRKLAIEAGVEQGWWKYVGDKGDVLCLNRFGASAPESVVYKKLGFHVDRVIGKITKT